MYSDSVAIINLKDYSVSGYINLRRSSETIVVSGNKAFISEWVGGNEVMVINTINNKVIDSIKVGLEPESMVIDKNNDLMGIMQRWLDQRLTLPNCMELIHLPIKVEKKLVFPDKTASPTCLQIDGRGETLYYLENGVRKMSIKMPYFAFRSFNTRIRDHIFIKLPLIPPTVIFSSPMLLIISKMDMLCCIRIMGLWSQDNSAGVIPGYDVFQT